MSIYRRISVVSIALVELHILSIRTILGAALQIPAV